MRKQLICPRCGTTKKTLTSGALRCPTCTRKWNREYYHRSAKCRQRSRINMIERKYGVSMDFIEQLLAEQKEKCAICGRHWTDCTPAKNSRYDDVFLQRLYIDHCHETGKVRGLLCNNCNSAIAMLAEDPARCDAAKAYILKWRDRGI